MAELGVGQEKGEILGLWSGEGLEMSAVDGGGVGDGRACARQGGVCSGTPTGTARGLACAGTGRRRRILSQDWCI